MSNQTAEKLSEAEIIKKNICDSCYDQGLHNLVNTPVEQVASAMREHTKQRLTALKDAVIALKDSENANQGEVSEIKGYLRALRDVKTLIENELQ